MKTLSIETVTHGRVLVRETPQSRVVVIGFHGYMENADIQMERLLQTPGSDAWTLVSVQGLHRFYRGRSEAVVAGWMTRQDRDEAIADNIRYVDRVVAEVASGSARLATVGFSQGVATAFRAGIRGHRRAHAIVAAGGDIPPELLADPDVTFPPSLLARGERDDWYTGDKLQADADALRARGVNVTTLVYPGGHEWTHEVASAAANAIGHIW